MIEEKYIPFRLGTPITSWDAETAMWIIIQSSGRYPHGWKSWTM